LSSLEPEQIAEFMLLKKCPPRGHKALLLIYYSIYSVSPLVIFGDTEFEDGLIGGILLSLFGEHV